MNKTENNFKEFVIKESYFSPDGVKPDVVKKEVKQFLPFDVLGHLSEFCDYKTSYTMHRVNKDVANGFEKRVKHLEKNYDKMKYFVSEKISKFEKAISFEYEKKLGLSEYSPAHDMSLYKKIHGIIFKGMKEEIIECQKFKVVDFEYFDNKELILKKNTELDIVFEKVCLRRPLSKILQKIEDTKNSLDLFRVSETCIGEKCLGGYKLTFTKKALKNMKLDANELDAIECVANRASYVFKKDLDKTRREFNK